MAELTKSESEHSGPNQPVDSPPALNLDRSTRKTQTSLVQSPAQMGLLSDLDDPQTAAELIERLATDPASIAPGILERMPVEEWQQLSDAQIAECLGLTERGGRATTADLCFMPSPLVQCGLPTTRVVGEQRIVRRNGHMAIEYTSLSSDHELPYGVPARAVLMYLATQAVQRKSRVIQLGPTLTGFITDAIGKKATRGARGSIARYGRTFASMCVLAINQRIATGNANSPKWETEGESLTVVHRYSLWGEEDFNYQIGGVIELSSAFYEWAINHAVPFSQSDCDKLLEIDDPLAWDIYQWVKYRQYKLAPGEGQRSGPAGTRISWGQLHEQMGKQIVVKRNFIRNFKKAVEALEQHNLISGLLLYKDSVCLISRHVTSPAELPSK